MRCDYARPLSTHTCRGDGVAAYHVTVRYNELEADHVHLCCGCKDWVKCDTREHTRATGRKYKVTVVKMAPPVTAEVRL